MLHKPEGDPEHYSEKIIVDELTMMSELSFESLLYFVANYVYIFSNDDKKWIEFALWDTDCEPYDNQITLAKKIFDGNFVAILKARQIGITWLSLAIALWYMLFHPTQAVLLLSKGEAEAKELLKRLKGMYYKLPYWMQAETTPTDNLEEFVLSNGSRAKSVSTKGGDSMSFTIAIIDEADLIYRANTPLKQVLLNVEPTVGINGKLILLSKSEKSRPSSTFKSIYRAAARGKNRFVSAFVPWKVNPRRTQEWYEQQTETSLSIDGTLDNLHESYPATPEEALSPKSGNKRIPYTIAMHVYKSTKPLLVYNDFFDMPVEYDGPEIHGLTIYEYPQDGEEYAIGVDPSEGIATGDNAGLSIVKVSNICQVAVFKGKVDPSVLARYTYLVSDYYNNASVMYERNNHGILFGKEMRESYSSVKLLKGWTATGKSTKPGWFTTTASKSYMYDEVAKLIRETGKRNRSNDDKTYLIVDEDTYVQLTSVEADTYKAPQGEEDDLAIAHSLAIVAVIVCMYQGTPFALIKL